MFPFIQVTMVTEFLRRNRTLAMMEVGTWEQSLAVTGLDMMTVGKL